MIGSIDHFVDQQISRSQHESNGVHARTHRFG
jgi:hypothetical protein